MVRGGCDASEGAADYSGSRVTTADEGRGWRSRSCTLERAFGDSKVEEVEEVDVSKRLSFVKCRLQILARGRPLDHSDLPSGCCKCRGLG